MEDDMVIAKIRKSSVSELWIVAKEFRGRKSCDVREYFHPADSAEWLPTKKGVSIPPDLILQAADGVEKMADKEDLGEVLSIPRGETACIRFAIREFQRHIYAEIRVYYRDRLGGNDWKPGKGATLRPEMLTQLAEALRLAQDYLESS